MKKSKRNSRDLGLKGGGAGKGDAPRYKHDDNWVKNFDAIDWHCSSQLPSVPPDESAARTGDNHNQQGQGNEGGAD